MGLTAAAAAEQKETLDSVVAAVEATAADVPDLVANVRSHIGTVKMRLDHIVAQSAATVGEEV